MTLQLDAFLLSFAVIFVAELGDKSQLMALAFATRYRAIDVLVGITACDAARPPRVRRPRRDHRRGAPDGRHRDHRRAGVLRASPPGRSAATRSTTTRPAGRRAPTRSVILAVGTAFFLAELGDKTMLATITLATREEPSGRGSDRRPG